ncbi:protein phosphatase 1 regulatory subunit 14C-like [Rhopilema esculentum]|uniref:protein phosphatase 1 regulatory subunit 14C-like n=1 Tax=Rhopilema esculentum TaxID=499914 RepID=UPI0031D9FDF7
MSAGQSDTKVLRFNSDVPTEVQKAKYQATAKYDIKLVRKRLEIEEWMHFELKKLYCCEEDEDYGVEIDVDVLMDESDENEQTKMLAELLKGAKEPTEDFIKELIKRVVTLEEIQNSVKKVSH